MPQYGAGISLIPTLFHEIVDAHIYETNLWKLG